MSDEEYEALAHEAEIGYDIGPLLARKSEGWVFAALCSWATRLNATTGSHVRCGKYKNVITIYDGTEVLARVRVETP